MRLRAQRREVLPKHGSELALGQGRTGIQAGTGGGGHRYDIDFLFTVLDDGAACVHHGPAARLLDRGPVRMTNVWPTWPAVPVRAKD
jgi:hypothetical protein